VLEAHPSRRRARKGAAPQDNGSGVVRMFAASNFHRLET
jgi:hypothetical protein